MTITRKNLLNLLFMAMVIVASLTLCACEDDDNTDVDENNRPAYLIGLWECGTHTIQMDASGRYIEKSGDKVVKDNDRWYVYEDRIISYLFKEGHASGMFYVFEYNEDKDILTLSGQDKYHRVAK